MEENKTEVSQELKKENTTFKKSFFKWYGKSYKLLLIVPAIIMVFSIIFLFNFFNTNGDVVYKDVSITGGTTITVFTADFSPEEITNALKSKIPDIEARAISDFRNGKQQAFFINTKAESGEAKKALEEFLGYELNSENSSIEFTGSTISSGFYQQLQIALLLSFLFMAIVVFIIFRTPIPSFAVILSAFANIAFTIVTIDLFNISLSIGGIVALLMLIGYSVDTDILLTSRVLRKKEDNLDDRMFGAFKTGITMTLTSLVAITVCLMITYNFSETLKQIFTILLIGLGFDIFNTWVTNASMLRWYMEAKGLK